MGKGMSSLSKEDIDFLQKGTHFKKDEIKEWHKGFLHDCPDGQLSKDKFKGMYAQFFPGGDHHAFCDHVFRSFDIDDSGSIDFKEFLLGIYMTSTEGDPKDKLNWAFSVYDINGDGTIDKSEMETIITSIHNILSPHINHQVIESPEEMTTHIFGKMDINSDGILSKEEFVQGCMKDQCLYAMLTAKGDAPR